MIRKIIWIIIILGFIGLGFVAYQKYLSPQAKIDLINSSNQIPPTPTPKPTPPVDASTDLYKEASDLTPADFTTDFNALRSANQ